MARCWRWQKGRRTESPLRRRCSTRWRRRLFLTGIAGFAVGHGYHLQDTGRKPCPEGNRRHKNGGGRTLTFLNEPGVIPGTLPAFLGSLQLGVQGTAYRLAKEVDARLVFLRSTVRRRMAQGRRPPCVARAVRWSARHVW